MLLPLSRLEPDDRFGPPSLVGGPTTTGEDAEKDKHVPPVSAQSNTSATSPKAEGSSSFMCKRETKVSVVESTDGATGSKYSITCVPAVRGLWLSLPSGRYTCCDMWICIGDLNL